MDIIDIIRRLQSRTLEKVENAVKRELEHYGVDLTQDYESIERQIRERQIVLKILFGPCEYPKYSQNYILETPGGASKIEVHVDPEGFTLIDKISVYRSPAGAVCWKEVLE